MEVGFKVENEQVNKGSMSYPGSNQAVSSTTGGGIVSSKEVKAEIKPIKTDYPGRN